MPDFQIDTLREVIISDYHIVYTLEREEVEILAVAHGSRDIFGER